MVKFKAALLIIFLLNVSTSYAILFSLLKDLAIGIQFLDEVNRSNREALLNSAKNLISGQNIPIYRNIDSQANNEVFTFRNLAGNIPLDVLEIVDFLNFPEKFRKIGAKMPKGILMVGPPGTGKTSIARAIAGEANAEFFHASASEFIELYVGVGPKRIRELFNSAREAVAYGPKKKAIIFIDELDAIGGSRWAGENSEYRNTLNELLNQMDGFKQDESIIVIGATNLPETIDSALKRPGRFDRIVEIGLPDEESRLAIIKLYCEKICYDENVDLAKFVGLTKGWTAADLENFVNEAARKAVRDNANKVLEKHFKIALQDELVRKRRAR